MWNLAAVAALTAYSTGIAWQAQFVSYPLYRAMSAGRVPRVPPGLQRRDPRRGDHPRLPRLPRLCGVPLDPAGRVPRLATALVAVSGLGSILSTVLWAIPRHDLLDRIGQDAATITSLIQANGVRTALLTLGAATLSWSLVRLIRR